MRKAGEHSVSVLESDAGKAQICATVSVWRVQSVALLLESAKCSILDDVNTRTDARGSRMIASQPDMWITSTDAITHTDAARSRVAAYQAQHHTAIAIALGMPIMAVAHQRWECDRSWLVNAM